MMNLTFAERCFSAQELCGMSGAVLRRDTGRTVRGLSTDSRTAKPGELFVALRGETTDGHRYLKDALARGVACVLTEEDIDGNAAGSEDFAVLLTDNTTAALGRLARAYKKRFSPLCVAVTGSVGKTTTKQLLSAVLGSAMHVLATEGNFNNEIGLPKTLLTADGTEDALVLEMGMNHAGELTRLSAIAEPAYAVITNIGTSHIEYLGSRAGIARAKLEIAEGMPRGGTLLIPGDEPLLTTETPALQSRGLRVLTVGDTAVDDFCVENAVSLKDRVRFDVRQRADGCVLQGLTVPAPGLHLCRDAAFAVALGLLCGLGEEQIRRGLEAFHQTGMRARLFDAGNCHIIEDCYNASPESVESSLALLGEQARAAGGQAVAVLGDMLELGVHSEELHRRIGLACARVPLDLLLCFGPLSRATAEGARAAGMREDAVLCFADASPENCVKALTARLHGGQTVLFKASRGMQLERVTEAFCRALNEQPNP